MMFDDEGAEPARQVGACCDERMVSESRIRQPLDPDS